MKIGFDIGGVISKYPEQLRELISSLTRGKYDGRDYSRVYVITDMHPKEKALGVLLNNFFIEMEDTDYDLIYRPGIIDPNNVYCADYEKYGNMAKAVLIKELGIDIFIDDFDGYLQWDSSLGPQPILLKVQPDNFRPYWSDNWKCHEGDFGRRKYAT